MRCLRKMMRTGSAEPQAEEEIPEAPRVAVTQPGDVWLIGTHRLICGDCRDLGRRGASVGRRAGATW